MEDTTNLSPKADASLYNGQPIDTGLSCPSAGLTSCTPSISKNKGGVSVENVPAENKQWFVLRVSYGRIDKAKTYVEAKGMECYVPLQYKEVRKQGKKRIITTPLLPSLIFVHASAEQVETLLHDNKIVANESRALLSYYFDHTIHCQDNP
ncbi:MAG: UpxY family transcription antiterminator, partial [Prevotella sp.]|nr:UpxY family transcription antiterminator [Prevotella sp.]